MLRRIAITPGEPAGIGPDLMIKVAQQDWPIQIVAVASPELLTARAKLLNLPLNIKLYNVNDEVTAHKAGTLIVLPVPLEDVCEAGVANPNNGRYVVETLRIASEKNISGEFDAVVTGPVHKGLINKAGIAFSGHTEYFAHQANCSDVVMMLATEGLRVALVTTHIPLAYVSKANPHAGEDGHLGREEIDVMIPALDELRSEGMNLIGPLPADTIFQAKYLDDADAILTMFHDQGLPVLKYKGFGSSVNITLGLPFIRTSVDHGTALDLAGTDTADAGSFYEAINTAITLANNHEKDALEQKTL